MKYPSGPRRKLSDRQIRAVLTWYETAVNFRRRHGTARNLAALLGVSSHVVRGIAELSDRTRGLPCPLPKNRRGRPRQLNAAQVAFVIAWREAGRQFLAQQGSVAELAHRMDVSASTIHDCIRRKGRYARSDHVGRSTTRKGGRTRPLLANEALRSKLLRAWRRACLPHSE
jgi:transposase